MSTSQHVNYALSYHHGSMLEWFEPDILSPSHMATWLPGSMISTNSRLTYVQILVLLTLSAMLKIALTTFL